MKKSLLITTSLLTLGVVTGIYAQSVGATGSIVDKMKAVAHSFTLGSTLNPTDTGLTSDPVKGKKTGDILTAGEYNRLLELLSEGGGGGSSVGGAGWVDVPLTDTSSFDINCEYRFRMSGVGGNSVIPGFSQTHWYDVTYKSAGAIANAAWVYLRPGNKQTVYLVDTSNNGVMDVTAAWGWKTVKIEKLCGGGSGGGNTGSGVAGIATAIRASGHTLTIPSGITDWPDTIVCDGYGGWAGGNQVLTLSVAAANTVGYTQSEGIGVYFNPSTGALAQADRVGTCGAGNIAAICAAGRCVYGSNGGSPIASVYTKCTNAQSLDATNIPCYSASRNTGAGTDQYRVVSCTVDDGVRTYTAASILNFNNLIANKWAISVNGGTLQCVDGSILVAKIQ